MEEIDVPSLTWQREKLWLEIVAKTKLLSEIDAVLAARKKAAGEAHWKTLEKSYVPVSSTHLQRLEKDFPVSIPLTEHQHRNFVNTMVAASSVPIVDDTRK